ncbi:MAG: hypothetical protein EZS28_017193 [Streblomastix strix]|uniref:Uncharacterized protein n=1 Tax=Streblomastix strix TaxID=222440 RepID=A0A5J4VY04_9EUKA|nr:MAG: hypothetical protein EZS28_017193 [Streblomastix strix]
MNPSSIFSCGIRALWRSKYTMYSSDAINGIIRYLINVLVPIGNTYNLMYPHAPQEQDLGIAVPLTIGNSSLAGVT